ncbi:MAG: hypothetical protein OCD76_03255 [Reichenbachiella sp.]
MNRRHLKIFLLTLIYVLFLTKLKGQGVREQFDSFKSGQEADFSKFVEQKDKEFADFLRKNWVSFQVHSGHTIEERKKPVEFPKAHKIVPEAIELDLSGTLKSIALSDELVMPVNYKSRSYHASPKSTYFPFYGDTVNIEYDFNLDFKPYNQMSTTVIADYWEQISVSDYRSALDGLLYQKMKYGLNDYGYYLLVKDFSASIFSTENEIRILTWFILAKSKYKTKIGYNGNEVYILLPSKRPVYGKSYFVHNDLTFYVMDYVSGEMFAYEEDYPDAYKTMDFSIGKSLNLKESLVSNKVVFKHEKEDFSFDFTYNKNAIDFYQAIPSIGLGGYFNAQLSSSTHRKLVEQLAPIVQEMTETEAVSFLLAMVQKGFEYKVDDEQFGKEKVFFPEEILHYPFSDCEDRSVFFAFLVNTLLGNEVIGLDYPAHVATAVRFYSDVPGDYFMFEGAKYVVCDPTYVDAPIGMSMRDLSNYSADIIRSESSAFNFPSIEKLKNLFGVEGDIESPKMIKIKGGSLMAAKFTSQVYVQGKELTATEGVLISSFDSKQKVNWSKTWGGETESELLDIIADQDNNIIVLSKEESLATQVAKFDSLGNELWSKAVPVLDTSKVGVNTLVTLFGPDGKELAGKSYLETAYLDNSPLSIRKGNILVVQYRGNDINQKAELSNKNMK